MARPARKPALLRDYERHVGRVASPRATNAWLAAEVAAARSAANANRRAAAVQVAALATTAVGSYRRVRAEQAADPAQRSIMGPQADRLRAAGSAAYAVAPGLALTSIQGSANALAHAYHHFSFGLAMPKVIAKPMEAVVKTAGRAVLPALAAWQMHNGAIEDHESAIRGAGRGLVRALDVTGIVMSKGLLERGYDKLAGTPAKDLPKPGWFDNQHDPKFKQHAPNGYSKFVDSVRDGIVRRALTPRADAGGGHKPAGGSHLDNAARARSERGERAAARGTPAAPEHRGGPVQVASYSKRDGTRVDGYTRQAA